MFSRLSRNRSDTRSGERIEFKFSNFQAFQVPKGLDKLFLTVSSVDTGKTIAKSNKAAVHGGTCQWTETFSESIWISQDGASLELEECLYKITVAMGSARAGILGEVILNLADYASSRDCSPISLPLKKCNHGTILQIKVQCHTPKMKFRDRKSSKESTSHPEELHGNFDDVDSKSYGSDNMFNKSVGSSSGSHLGIPSYPDEHGNKDMNFSASGSHRSSDSGESYTGRTNFSPINSLNGGSYVGREGSSGSHASATYVAGPGDDFSRSNQSSFNSRASGSSFNTNQWQEITAQSSANDIAPLSLKPSDSAKDILEAAEETIDELRDEAKMWERHSRKLKLDLETLKKESTEKSKHQTDLQMELTTACNERNSLRQEVDQLKSSLEELISKQTVTHTTNVNGMIHLQNELENEARFLKETNSNLAQQLKKTQEANIELVSILQELEETVEKQNLEIAKLSQNCHVNEHEGSPGSRTLLDIETECASKLSLKEEEVIKLERKLSDILNAQPRSELVYGGGHPDLIKEIEDLKSKIQELERDCAELTDENLELIFKMKELEKDVGEGMASHKSIFNELFSPDNSEFEISKLKLQINQLEEELKKKEMFGEDNVRLKIQIESLEKKCFDLDLELQHFKEQAYNLDMELQKSQAEVEDKIGEITELKFGTSKDTVSGCGTFNERNIETNETCSTTAMSNMLLEMNKQLRLAFTHVRNICSNGDFNVNTEYIVDCNFITPSSTDTVIQMEQQVEAMLNDFYELNTLLREKIVECKSLVQGTQTMIGHKDADPSDTQEYPDGSILEEQVPEKLMTEVNFEYEETYKEAVEKSEIVDLKACSLQKEKEIEILKNANMELEHLVSNVQREKDQLDKELANVLKESSATSKCLNDVRHDQMILTSNLESKESTIKMLERKSMELESGKHELDLHISELEQENVELSERISGLEAQLRYLTNEKGSNRLELEDSRSLIVDLKDEIEKQKNELEAQKAELKQKLQEAQNLLSEALEESGYLKRSHSKLQATVESLIEECSSLEKLTSELKRQKLELHEHSTHLEVKLNESQKKSINFCEKVEFLNETLSSLQKDIASKEKLLLSQLENIFQAHNGHGEKISQAHIMLNQMESAKKVDVQNLETQIAHLTSQLSSTHDERERIASDAVCEVFNLRSDKIKLENSLQDIHAKVKLYESELHTLRQESDNKVQGLVDLLNASKQSEEMLMGDIERMQRLMETFKSSEEKFGRTVNELELKIKASDYEKQQTTEEILSLKVQLQKLTHLQDEILDLKSSFEEERFEKGKLEKLLHSVSAEHEELKTERVSFMEKISSMQRALHDGEDDRRNRIALEEKLLRMEGDLTAREASYAHEAELKNELNRIKRVNSDYQRKIQCVEEDKKELFRKAQVLEKELKLKREENQGEGVPSEVENKLHDCMERPQVSEEVDLALRIQLLENELAGALEANNMYKMQLTKSLSEKQDGDTDVFKKTSHEIDYAAKISSLEAELKDVQERYLHMSLQYAELEAQREELVMQLKSTKKEKRWFS